MDAGLLFLGAILGGVLGLVAIGIWATVWSQIRHAEIEARIKQDMARVKQDMLSRGLSVEDIERLLTPDSAGTPMSAGQLDASTTGTPSHVALSLAAVIEDMVHAEKDADQIAAFLVTFLEQNSERLEMSTAPTQPGEPTGTTARRSAIERFSNGMVPALESMVVAERDTQEIAAFLDTVLHTGKGPLEIGKDRNQLPLAQNPASEDLRLPQHSIRPYN